METRSRSGPTHLVLYFTMALALWPGGCEEIVGNVGAGSRYSGHWSPKWEAPTGSATRRALERLGAGVIAYLFAHTAGPLASDEAWWVSFGGVRAMAVDPVRLDMADTAVNRLAYPDAGVEPHRVPPGPRRCAGGMRVAAGGRGCGRGRRRPRESCGRGAEAVALPVLQVRARHRCGRGPGFGLVHPVARHAGQRG
ncbi:MAG: transposase domain-containing protein [Bifidobacteriaceae bacterium]|nr:transposase domain-containing protein [Bifidobacteriaceae bacterium]